MIPKFGQLRLGFCAAVMATLFSGAAAAEQATDYQYDALGRLIKVDVSGGPKDGTARDYALDDAGNRTSVVASTYGAASTVCSLRTADVTVGDNFPAYVQISAVAPCAHSIALSYTIRTLSGTGSYTDGGFGIGGAVMAANATSKTLRIYPTSGSVPTGKELVLQVQFGTQTADTEFALSSSIVTISSGGAGDCTTGPDGQMVCS